MVELRRESWVARPIRPAEKLEKYPASTMRVVKQDGCVAATA